ncbi:MAG: DUF3857 domain-containing protein [Bacteroidales bacterium]|nr:DUF3857 domain-containing protein [Bacteroidales bacterium]
MVDFKWFPGFRVFVVLHVLSIISFQKITIAQDEKAVLLYTSTEIEIRDGKMISSYSFDLLINDRSADYLSKVVVPYSKLEKLNSLEASLHNLDGSLIRKLTRKEIVDKNDISNSSLYEDQFCKVFTLRNSTFPYRVKWSYITETSEFVTICNWIPVINSEIPTQKAKLRIITPDDYKLRIKSSGISDSSIVCIDHCTVQEWECSFHNVYAEESFQEDNVENMPRVWAVPLKFHYDRDGRADGWKEFGGWVNELNYQLHWLPETEKLYVASVIENNSSRKEQIRKLFYYVQDKTRYVNLTIETGGKKPLPANYVAEKGYGDCKALTIYLKALLQEAGIPGYYTLLKAGIVNKDIDDLFVANQFNHAILMVPLESDSLWLDCTSNYPLSYTGSFIQNRYALVVGDSGGSIARIPALSKQQVWKYRKGTIELSASGPAEIKLQISTGGEEAERIRYICKKPGYNGKIKALTDFVNIPSFVNDSLQIVEFNRDSERNEIVFFGKSNTLVQFYGSELVLPLIPLEPGFFAAPTERTTRMKLPFPVCLTDTISFIIPEGYQAAGLPGPRSEKSESGIYEISFTSKGDEILLARHFEVKAGVYSHDDYENLYSFIMLVRRIESASTITFSKL